jgi:hypothetical protein
MIRLRQQGQAIPEVLAIGIVMVPLFLMIPIMGKVADMNQKTIMASRYGAWERTVYDTAKNSSTAKQEITLIREARHRFFGRNDVYIETLAIPQEKDKARSLLWRTATDKPMLRRFSDVRNRTETDKTKSMVKTGFNVADRVLNITKPWKRTFEETDSIYRSTFSVRVATNELDAFKRGKNCNEGSSSKTLVCIKRHNAIYTDTWNAGSSGTWDDPKPGEVTERVQRMMPTAIDWVQDTGELFKDIIGWVPIFKEAKLLDLGYVDPDRLPADRTGGRIWFKRSQ